MASLNSSVFMKKFREILRGVAIYIVLLCVLGVVGYFQFNNTDEEAIAQPLFPRTQVYSLDQCKTCDYDGCFDATVFTRLSVDREKKSYKLFSISKDNREYEFMTAQPEVCQFNLSGSDPFSFSCQSDFRADNVVGKRSIRLEHNRLTLEKEHQPSKASNYSHVTTTCPINFPLM